MAAFCVASLAGVSISPLLARKISHGAYTPALALFVYFLGCMLMPLFGAFPVPLVGMGMSPILGFWFGIGVLITACADVYSTGTADPTVRAATESS
jgi:hypothetical protein